METIKCPYCGEEIEESLWEDMGDIGCPSCRRLFDIEDYEQDYSSDFIPRMPDQGTIACLIAYAIAVILMLTAAGILIIIL